MKTHRAMIAVSILATSVLVAPPAEAAWNKGSIRHHSPDNGYDLPFLVDCAGESGWQRVKEGQHSDDVCDSEDVNRVRLRDRGEEITCFSSSGTGSFVWLDGSDSDMTKSVGDFTNIGPCVNGLK